jgi:hypothetical protein
MYAIRVNKNTANRVSSRMHHIPSDSSLVGFFLGDSTVKYIKLTQGKQAIVDDDDFRWLNQRNWHADKGYSCYYAARGKRGSRKPYTVLMHRQIMKPPEGMEVDHINHDGLDNRRENLRLCTRSQNRMNSLRPKTNKSGFKGVAWNKRNRKWQVQLYKNRRCVYLGLYFCIIKAAEAYDKAAIKEFGEFARLNFPESAYNDRV